MLFVTDYLQRFDERFDVNALLRGVNTFFRDNFFVFKRLGGHPRHLFAQPQRRARAIKRQILRPQDNDPRAQTKISVFSTLPAKLVQTQKKFFAVINAAQIHAGKILQLRNARARRQQDRLKALRAEVRQIDAFARVTIRLKLNVQ